MHRAILISVEDEIEAEAIHLSDAPAPVKEETSQTAEGGTLADMEKQMILNTLDQTLGNRTHAAKILGISIRTLRNKLQQYNIDREAS